MAGRIRSIKPEILDDEKTAGLSHLEYRVFTGLWLIADDYGNLRANADYVRGQLLWARSDTSSADVADALAELARINLVVLYVVRGQSYCHVSGWHKHQKVDKPGKPRVPGPAEADAARPRAPALEAHEDSRESRESPAKVPETPATDLRSPTDEQREGEGPACARARSHTQVSVMPDGWTPSADRVDVVRAERDVKAIGVVVDLELTKFRAWAIAEGVRVVDWDSKWIWWLTNARPTHAAVREALAQRDREKNRQAARDRERVEADTRPQVAPCEERRGWLREAAPALGINLPAEPEKATDET